MAICCGPPTKRIDWASSVTLERSPPALVTSRTKSSRESSPGSAPYVIGHAAGASSDPGGFWTGLLEAGAAPDELPTLSATGAVWRALPAEQLRTGLELLLDGVAARVARRPRARTS